MKLTELYKDKILGSISGLDRIRFRGTLRLLANQRGMRKFMSFTNVLLKDFGGWAEGLTARIRQSCRAKADALGIETHYLRRPSIDKEAFVREVAASRGIQEGSLCMLSAVEPAHETVVKQLPGSGRGAPAAPSGVLLVGGGYGMGDGYYV